MVTTLSTCAFFPTVFPASTSSRKSLISFPILKHTSPRSKVKVNVQSSSNINATKIATKDDVPIDLLSGRFVEKSLVFRQYFSIRSYEVGGDRTASIETLMNLFQEVANNHIKGAELIDYELSLAVNNEFRKRNLVWVVVKMHVIVDHYPMWRDVVEVDTWVTTSGKNGMRQEWLVRDSSTGDILARATSFGVLMNTNTRKLSKIPSEIREELEAFFMNSPPPVMDMDSRNIPKLDAKNAQFIRKGLTPSWNDLDMVQHVNNVKYVSWIIESIPLQILKTHKLVGISLEYRRECMSDSVVQSLTSIVDNSSDDPTNTDFKECQHFLCFEGGEEVAKGMTKWKPAGIRSK